MSKLIIIIIIIVLFCICASSGGIYFYIVNQSNTAYSSAPKIVSQNTASLNTALLNAASLNAASLNAITPISILNNDPTLFLYYTFKPDTINGTNINNNGKLVLDAKIVNGATINTTDRVGRTASMQFVAVSSQYIQINPFTTTGNNGITFLFWCKFNNSDSYSRIFDFGNGEHEQNILIGILNGQLYAAVVNDGKNRSSDRIIYSENINDNIWRHIALIISPTTGSFTIYVNAIFNQTINNSIYPDNTIRNYNYLGKSNWNDPYLNGAIDDFRMYNRVLSVTEILTIYNNIN